jgi:predicted Na+-dependent transporter
MEITKVTEFVKTHSQFFSTSDIASVQKALEKSDDNRYETVQNAGYQSVLPIFLSSLLLPFLGLDRYLTGAKFIAFLRVASFALIVILAFYMTKETSVFKQGQTYPILAICAWYVVEICTSWYRTKKYNLNKIMRIVTED